jgi:hypothetical protein
MSNYGPFGSRGVPNVPTLPRGESIGRYDTYLDAQRAVDFLSDERFPVQFVTIVGTGLRMVERVTGRLTYPRVAGAGAASGAWFGFFVGLLLSLFAPAGESVPLVAAILLGAGFGMLFGLISYTLTRGRRDFTSTSQIVAGEYEVLCAPEHAQAAREALWRLPGGRGTAPASVPGPTSQGPTGQGPAGHGTQGGWPPPVQPPTGPGGYPHGWGKPDPISPPDAPGGVGPAATPPHGLEPGAAPAAPEPDVSGPTYGEMIERKRREEAERRAREDTPES